MRQIPEPTRELMRSLLELARVLEHTADGMDSRRTPLACVQVRVFSATCDLAAARLDELSQLLEELAPLVPGADGDPAA
jgi:hypothetical protein